MMPKNDPHLIEIKWKNEVVMITQSEVDAIQPDHKLLAVAKKEFSRHMNIYGEHGLNHWKRVRENGLVLSRLNGANRHVVVMFSIFHDCRRVSEGDDKLHGYASAKFLLDHRELIPLDDADFELLRRACYDHNNGITDDPDITVKTCWDADRLDLGRVGKMPHPNHLCTDEAKDAQMIEWAYKRSRLGRAGGTH